MTGEDTKTQSIVVGRYVLHRQIARGGMATIHIARLTGDEGFSRIVAAKRLLPDFAEDSEFVAMFMDEARIASKIHHPNVVPVLDLVATADEVMLVQEYVHGVPLHVLLRTANEQGKRVPVRIAVSIATQVLAGLRAAHTTLDEDGASLDIVHRDVSPQNVMIAVDGSARLLDFGVAKTTMAAHVTRNGTFKGKLAYSSPEQIRGKPVQQSDLYSLAVVLWEMLVGHRLFGTAQGEGELIARIMTGEVPTITNELSQDDDWGQFSSDDWRYLSELDIVVAKGLAVDLSNRFQSAAEMEKALVKACPPASSSDVASWVKALGKEFLEARDKIIAVEEQSWRRVPKPSRLTPIPGSLSALSLPPPGSTPAPQPGSISMANTHITVSQPAEGSRTRRTILAVAGALLLVLFLGVVIGMRSRDPQRPERSANENATTQTVMPSKAPPPKTTSGDLQTAPTAPVNAPPTAAAPPAPAPTTVPAPTSPPTDAETVPATAANANVPATAPPRVNRIRRVVRSPEVKAAPPPPAPPTQAPDDPKANCSPPYYFEGSKKIFKPQCL